MHRPGANNIALAEGATLTISGGGLIKAGGNVATISGGDGIASTGSTGDFVIRTAVAADVLTIASNITAATTAGITKVGAGTLTLSGTGNAFTGGVTVNGGTIRFSSEAALPATGQIKLGQSTTGAFDFTFDQAFLASRVAANQNAATIAIGARNSNNLDFSTSGLNYANYSLGAAAGTNVTYSGALTPFGNTYRLGGGTGTLTYTTPITGNNALVIGSGGSAGTVVLNQANSYTGGTTIVAGTLRVANASALGSTAGDVAVNGGTLDLRSFNSTLTNLSGTGSGATITDNTPSSTLTTTVTANILAGSRTYSGSINNGSGGRKLALVKDGPGVFILNKANGHNYTGGTFINAGRLEIRTNNAQVLPNGANLTFNGSGTFAAVNNGAVDVTTAGLTLGTLTLNKGDAIIESSQLNASTTHLLTFAAVPTRAPGATGNFTLSVATDPSLYKVKFTNAPASGQSVNGGLFYNYSDFLAYDAAGYARNLRYTGTPDSNATDVGLGASQATIGAGITGRDVQIVGSGYDITAQISETIRTLKIASENDITLAAGQTLTISAGGIIKAGGGTSVISGGAGITTGTTSDLVVNTDLTSDILTIASPIEAGSGGGLTKTGLGTLNLSGLQDYALLALNAGTTNIDGAIGTGGTTVDAFATTNIGASQMLDALNIGPGVTVTLGEFTGSAAPSFGGEGPTAFAPDAAQDAVSVQAVPEPSAAATLLVGALGVLGSRRRRVTATR